MQRRIQFTHVSVVLPSDGTDYTVQDLLFLDHYDEKK